MNEKKRVGIYARVSTADQSPENQVLDLQQYSNQRGWEVFRIYMDLGISGAKDSRPSLDMLMDDARKRRLDMVLVWRFDRFARSTKHLILALEEFRGLGVDFVSFQESIDTSSPLGEAVFVIVAAVAKLERDIIAERVKAGLRMAVERGKTLGRPKALASPVEALRLRSKGLSHREIGATLGISHSTVGRLLRSNGSKTSPKLGS